ncbi:MAG TPA: rod-binding protein [Burkholderiales bacterium]|nr:rod-binding protein [Burkholderiales bacterium]
MTPVAAAGLSIDPNALERLHTRAVEDPEGALKEVAHQFAALLLDQMMKSMRTAAPGNSLFDGENTRLYNELLDQEFAAKLASQGGLGLVDMLMRQLSPALHIHGQENPKSADKQSTDGSERP